ncbi:hypothetical protein [Mesorhizobium sp. M9A.F.Ca.ET.002.03.1.2]|nr:hypothetical protein [Mesorhizobium sp. M9A.F.Ca.ET.002.03.1.2]
MHWVARILVIGAFEIEDAKVQGNDAMAAAAIVGLKKLVPLA